MIKYHHTLEPSTALPTKSQLEELLRALKADRLAIALALPQLGILARAFAVKSGIVPLLGGLYINPEITMESTGRTADFEGCRSLPSENHLVSRANRITMKYLDYRGNQHSLTLSGFAARIVQHEIDHLEGKMIGHAASPLPF